MLPAGGSCLLGSLNLAAFVNSDCTFDMVGFRKAVRDSVYALNEVLDEGLPLHPLPEQRESVRDWRQIGLGIFGLADMLIKMKVRYGSPEAIELCDTIGLAMADESIMTSAIMAETEDTYPKYKPDDVMSSEFYCANTSEFTKSTVYSNGLHNSQLMTIAPTGTLSTMLGVSGGIEPIFANYYERKTESLHGHDEYYKVYTPIVKAYMDANNIDDDSKLPDFFVTAQNLNYKERIDMQAVWQKHIDASISSTVNVANDFTVDEVVDLYTYAWEKGLKGVTIFRDGCKRTGVLTTNSNNTNETDIPETTQLNIIQPITREQLGKRLNGSTYVKNVACGKLYITINRDDHGNLVEVFIDSGKSGGCSANAECLGRYASAAMRSGMSIESVIDITKGVKCSACTQAKGSKLKHIDGLSCGDVLARTIKEEYELMRGHVDVPIVVETKPIVEEGGKCPECGHKLSFEGGCNTCKNCGYSKCD